MIGHKDSNSNDRVALRELYDFNLYLIIYVLRSQQIKRTRDGGKVIMMLRPVMAVTNSSP